MTDRLAQIQARAQDCQSYNFGMRNADKLAHEDVPALLAMVRERDAALERVRKIAASMDRIADFNLGVIPHDDMGISLRQHAEDIRAAITATEGA